MTAPFVPPADDSSVQMLRAVFGNIIDHLAGSSNAVAQSLQSSMLASAFEYFNSGILFFGSFLLTWITLVGTAHTANDGQALGRNWSTMWTPIRTISATGVLMPLSSGYSVIQAIVLTLVLWSVGLASAEWGKVVDTAVNGNLVQQATTYVINDSKFQDATTAALRMQVCARAVNRAVNEAITPEDGSAPPINLLPHTREIDIGDTHAKTFYYADPNWPRSEGFCGAVTLKTSNPTNSNTQSGLISATTKQFFFLDNSRVSQQLQNAMAGQVQGITDNYFDALFDPSGQLGAIAEDIVAGSMTTELNPQDLVAVIGLGSQMWNQITEAAESAAQSSNENITDTLTAGGWIYAGSWQTEISRATDAIKTTIGNVKVEVTPAKNDLSSSLSGDLLEATQPIVTQAQVAADELTKKAIELIRTGGTYGQGVGSMGASNSTGILCRSPASPISQDGIDPTQLVTDGGDSIKQRVSDYFNRSIGESMVSCIISNITADGVDPIIQLKGLGDTLMTSAESILAAAKLAEIAADAAQAGVDAENNSLIGEVANVGTVGASKPLIAAISRLVTGFIKAASADVSKPVSFILYAGYFLSIWLPMIPFMVFGLGVIGWLVSVVEAAAASSLWMVMHITPEGGDGFIGGQKQGYLLLMSVFFRPALMVLGLVASMALTIPAMEFINAGFVIKMKSLQVNSVTGIGSIVGYLIVYCFLTYSTIMIIFALPQTLPDRILRWIGAGIGDIGEQASMSRIEMGASAKAKAAVFKAFVDEKKNDAVKGRQTQTKE